MDATYAWSPTVRHNSEQTLTFSLVVTDDLGAQRQ